MSSILKLNHLECEFLHFISHYDKKILRTTHVLRISNSYFFFQSETKRIKINDISMRVKYCYAMELLGSLLCNHNGMTEFIYNIIFVMYTVGDSWLGQRDDRTHYLKLNIIILFLNELFNCLFKYY